MTVRQKIIEQLNRIPGFHGLSNAVKTSVISGVVVLVWLLSGFLLPSGPALEVPDTITNRLAAEATVKVVVNTIKPQSYKEKLSIRGHTEADRTVRMASQTSGIIQSVPVEKGEFVKQGQIVCQIQVAAREAQLAEAKALMKSKEIDYTAAKKLVEKGHFSLSRAAAAEAAFDTAKALVAQRRIELDRTRIKAPFDGVLDSRHVEVGDYIQIGQPCGMIVDKDPLVIVTQISEKQVGALGVGAKGKARLATGEVVTGTISYLAEKADPATRTFRLEMDVPNPENKLRDGVSADLEVEGRPTQAHLLPHGSITLDPSGTIGAKTVENGITKFNPITILSDGPEGVWIKGLTGTQDFIVIGQEFAVSGRAVQVDKSDSTVAKSGDTGTTTE